MYTASNDNANHIYLQTELLIVSGSLAQSIERSSDDRKGPGSNPGTFGNVNIGEMYLFSYLTLLPYSIWY